MAETFTLVGIAATRARLRMASFTASTFSPVQPRNRYAMPRPHRIGISHWKAT